LKLLPTTGLKESIMFVVVVEFLIHAQHCEDFKHRVKKQALDSLELEQDCHVFDVCVDAGRVDLVLLYEVYTDKQGFDTHLQSTHFQDFNDTVKSWVKDKEVSTFERL
jgi:autoinducer 2-degrading protein